MIIQIRTRNDNGKFVDVSPGGFAEAALNRIIGFAGWIWMRDWLCRVCLQQAEMRIDNPGAADEWIARYKAIRGIL